MTPPGDARWKGARMHEQSGRHVIRGSGADGRGCPAPGATVSLRTAARVLGISPSDAEELAEAEEFPCGVVQSADGYRVPFRSLLRVLRSQVRPVAGPRPWPRNNDEKDRP